MDSPDLPADTQERFGPALVQHGPLSDRVYLMRLGDPEQAERVLPVLEDMAMREGYSKFFAKVPEGAAPAFAERGFEEEARVPGMERGSEDVCFMARYYDEARREPVDERAVEKVLRAAEERSGEGLPEAGEDYVLRPLDEDDCEDMARVFAAVFESYPFPVHDPEYLRETMRSHVRYFGAFKDGELAAVASAEVDEKGLNAEMTDFATLPEHRSKGLAGALLREMHADARETGIRTAYTIARAVSFGMNITFARAGYRFGGTLTRNTNIAGRLECMNVWHRPMRKT